MPPSPPPPPPGGLPEEDFGGMTSCDIFAVRDTLEALPKASY